jgi:hypothetical protein
MDITTFCNLTIGSLKLNNAMQRWIICCKCKREEYQCKTKGNEESKDTFEIKLIKFIYLKVKYDWLILLEHKLFSLINYIDYIVEI